MAKKVSGLGIWCKLKSLKHGNTLWIGSAHLTQGSTRELHATEVHDFLRSLPTDELPVLIGVDANASIKWGNGGQGLVAVGNEGKSDYMLNVLAEKGIVLSPPPPQQTCLPTCRPRNSEAQGRHIDVVGGKNVQLVGKGILVDSHRVVGSDHDAVFQNAALPLLGLKRKVRRPNTRARCVYDQAVVPDVINQHELRKLAKQVTKPYKGMAYEDPQHVKVCFQVARQSSTSENWKRALRERDKARRGWRESSIAFATSGDWQAYRLHSKKGANGWEDHLAESLHRQGLDPHQAVHDHFDRIYKGQAIPPFPFPSVPRSPDFTVEELRMALEKGKNRKSTGEDGVSHELLKAIAREDRGEERILEWFNRLLHGQEKHPKDWERSIMIVLPKCAKPEKVKQLRPICIGAAANKVYARMLLARAKSSFKYSGPVQNMGTGRQTIDYIWIISRLMSLDQEWKGGLHFLKLDIEKAFDSLHRGKFLSRLTTKMGASEELRSWWAMFQNTEAGLFTAWGESNISMSSGIRQGSVESPQVFASAIDWIIHDVAVKHSWNSSSDVYEGLEFAETAFVDDCILWNGSRSLLQQRVCQLIEELSLWGLRVNPEKCQYYVSPFCSDFEPLKLGNLSVVPDKKLDVMGISFHVGSSSQEALQGIFTRTKNKFWALKHLFRAKTPLAGRMKLMQKVLMGTSLWCVGAFVPDKQGLLAINTLQAQLTVWAMRLVKPNEMPWVEFRIKCFRSARYAISTHVTHRWSTLWLQRTWGYSGHRARCYGWDPKPGCASLDRYRTLQWWQETGAAGRVDAPG